MRHSIGIYVRVSTEEQAQIADGSLESQQHRINAFIDIKKHQEKNWGQIIETYIDDGYSAGSTNRPAYQRMIRDLKTGKINLILVTDLSRLSRNIADFCDLYKELGKYKANFLSIKEQFDTSTPIGEMMVFNMVNLAQFERKQTSERISMNFHSRAMRGLVNGGNPLLGYDRDPANAGKRIINKEEAALVRKIFEMYNQGQSQYSIVAQLTHESEKRKIWSTKYRHIKEGRWTKNSVQNILKNYSYIGKREVNIRNKNEKQEYLKAWQQYQVVPAAWPAIVDEKVFYKVQERLSNAHLDERKRLDNSTRRAFLVSGRLRCGHCGKPLIGESAHGRSKVHRYYAHKLVVGEKLSCPITRYSASMIEQAITLHLDRILNENGYLDGIEANIEKSLGADRRGIRKKKAEVAGSIEKLDNEIEGILKIAVNLDSDSAGSELIQNKIQKLAEKKKILEQELMLINQSEMDSSVLDNVKKYIEDGVKMAKKSFSKSKPFLQKKLLSSLFKQLLVTNKGIKIFYHLSDLDQSSETRLKTKKPSGISSDGFGYFLQQTIHKGVSHGSFIGRFGGTTRT